MPSDRMPSNRIVTMIYTIGLGHAVVAFSLSAYRRNLHIAVLIGSVVIGHQILISLLMIPTVFMYLDSPHWPIMMLCFAFHEIITGSILYAALWAARAIISEQLALEGNYGPEPEVPLVRVR